MASVMLFPTSASVLHAMPFFEPIAASTSDGPGAADA